MPWLQLFIGVGVGFEGSILHEDNVVYHLLVPLKPPPGHAFHLDLHSEGKAGMRTSCLFVQLQCTCIRKQPVVEAVLPSSPLGQAQEKADAQPPMYPLHRLPPRRAKNRKMVPVPGEEAWVAMPVIHSEVKGAVLSLLLQAQADHRLLQGPSH
ncbi:hypothetical protein CIB84_006277 [Bambusicola thoracicus]|uniref:Uncharacterized protein n=1 Tax=Bambusicola thoracicus TaxID=9083 RepID=A0A2P4T0T6_BAMTH|nr:hypothetical protein CIB84_006277 [Bambusicola thoracicus]